MSPALETGDRVLVWRYWPRQCLRRGQIVIIQQLGNDKDSESFIKRVIGLPGDTLVTSLDDVPEPLRLEHGKDYDKMGKRTWHISDGQVFLRGDAPESVDSTTWGPVAIERISGVVIKKLIRHITHSKLPPLRITRYQMQDDQERRSPGNGKEAGDTIDTNGTYMSTSPIPRI